MLLYTVEIQESFPNLQDASVECKSLFSPYLFPSASEGKAGSTLSCLRKEPWLRFLILFPNPTGLEEREV